MPKMFSSNLRGKVRNFSLPKNRPLIPLYEAVVNSINAIEEREKKEKDSFKGEILIEVVRDRTLFGEFDCDTVRGFQVHDNGIGFNDENMASFMEADSDYKMEFGGKGVGRFSWLKAFSSVSIESTYKDGTDYFTRKFDFNLSKNDVEDTVILDENNKKNSTTIYLNDYLNPYDTEVPKQIETIANRIIQHCLVYLLSEKCPEIKIYDKNDSESINKMFKDRFATDDSQREIIVGKQKFSLLNLKITDRSFVSKNKLYLCANDRLVESKDLEKQIVDLDNGIFDSEGFWYLGILTGKYLDDNVDMNRLSFSISKESSILLPNNPGMDEIVNKASESIKDYLKDYLLEVEDKKKKRILSYTSEIAPQYRHLSLYVPDEIAALKPGLSNDQLDDALYSIKRKFENETKEECDNLIKKLDKGTISTDEYQKNFQKTIEKVSDVNRAALAEYVVHRKVILNLFKKGIEIKDDGKFNLEKYMHQLIYPMRMTSDELPYENHNLWLIDEKLSFCKFISSDKPFDNSNKEDRTDIMILDNPVAVAENENNGSTYGSIVIFELKKPMRDDYSMESNPVTQLTDYAQQILDGKVKDSKHRNIRATNETQFYLYAVCDITPSLERILNIMDFTKTADRLGAYHYNSNIHAYIEVLSFDKIRNDSEKRNHVLFEKLGIN